jgi:phosphatidate cytidylyltransferase
MATARSDLPRRLAVAAVGIPFGIWMIYLGGWPLAVVLAAVGGMGAHEVYNLAKARDVEAVGWLGLLVSAGLVLSTAVDPVLSWFASRAWVGSILLALAVFGWIVRARGIEGKPLEAASVTVTGALYTGGTLSFALLIRHLPEIVGPAITPPSPWVGTSLLIFPLFVTWMGDTFAYFGGRAFGKRPLAPKVSPKKTVEGGIAGLTGSVLSAVVFSWLVLQDQAVIAIPVGVAAVMGMILGLAAQLGDLAESVLKRSAGVKDSGTLLPGHGGVLDRFDAVFFTVPLCYLLYSAWVYLL